MRIDFLRVGDDWIQVYVDGQARYAGHSIQPDWIRELILLPVHSVADWYVSEDSDGPPDNIDFTDGKMLQLLSIIDQARYFGIEQDADIR